MSKENPMISVILPVYNVEKYLKECLDSILAQTYTNYELIVVNDGSTDNSLAIANEYKNKFERINIISQENKGLSEARNAGYNLITGKYTYFIDSDDFILSETFENLVSLAEEKQLDLIKFDAHSFAEEGVDYEMTNYDSSAYLQKHKLYNRDEYLKAVEKHFMPAVWMYFIKSELILDNKLYFKKGILHEDELFTVQLLKYCYRIMYDDNQYFQRRYRKNSIMTGNISKNQKAIESKILIIDLFQKMIELNPDDEVYNRFVKMRQNDLFTVLLFERNGKVKPYLNFFKRYELKIQPRTAMRHIRRNLKNLKK